MSNLVIVEYDKKPDQPKPEPNEWTLALDFAATTGWALGNHATGERKSGIWEYVRKKSHRDGRLRGFDPV